MNLYLIKSKVEKINQAKKDFKFLYGEDINPFTRKAFFYFFVWDSRKYVHKDSLRFVYTNADCYTTDIDPYYCGLTRIAVPDACKFLETADSSLLPTLVEVNDKFLVYQFYEGDPVVSINREEFHYLRRMHEEMSMTPFYNSMAYNLVRGKQGLKLVDLKHFEIKDHKPFFIYMHNAEQQINNLYLQKDEDMDLILSHLNKDYPADKALRYFF
jgi:hypothetical protein